jgi:hypothetical protein
MRQSTCKSRHALASRESEEISELRRVERRMVSANEQAASAEHQTRYEGGVDTWVDTHLQVVTSQTTAVAKERNDIYILTRRLCSNAEGRLWPKALCLSSKPTHDTECLLD